MGLIKDFEFLCKIFTMLKKEFGNPDSVEMEFLNSLKIKLVFYFQKIGKIIFVVNHEDSEILSIIYKAPMDIYSDTVADTLRLAFSNYVSSPTFFNKMFEISDGLEVL